MASRKLTSFFRPLAAAFLLLTGHGANAESGAVSMDLGEALRAALTGNHSVQAASFRASASKGRLDEARAGYLPGIQAGGTYTRYEEPMTVVPIHEVGKFPPLDDEIFDVGIQLSMPLLNGKTLAAISAAKADTAEAAAFMAKTRMEIMSRVASVFIASGELEDRFGLLDAHISALRERLRELEILEKEGRISSPDISLVRSSIASAASDRVNLETSGDDLSFTLGRLLGRDRPVKPRTSEWKEKLPPRENPGTGFPDASPAVLQAGARLEAAEHLKTAAVRGLWPELTGFASSVWRAGSDFDFTGEWAAGISLRIPLFDAARRVSTIKTAEAGVESARNTYLETRMTQLSLTEAAEKRISGLNKRRALLAEAVEEKRGSMNGYKERYKEGRLSLSDLLKQEAELLELRIQERSLFYREIGACLEYHSLRGSLSTELIESMLEGNA